MAIQSIDLIWIVVSDFEKALKFYTETVGMKVAELHAQYQWAELEGTDGGARLGICTSCTPGDTLKAGQNAVITFTVKDLEAAKADLIKKGGKCIGDVQVVPSCTLQTCCDTDGNRFQLVQMTVHSCCHC